MTLENYIVLTTAVRLNPLVSRQLYQEEIRFLGIRQSLVVITVNFLLN